MENYTIANEYTLPSEGKVYNKEVSPSFKIRSMTTAEEMRRLNHTDKPYKSMADIMDSCLVDDIGISAYDLCIADYQYMLHKLRVVTYGPEYKVSSTCPYCGTVNKETLNLDELKCIEFNKEELDEIMEFTLPVTQKRIKLRIQTPRIIDNINTKSKEARRKNPEMGESTFLFTLESLIDTIDGTKPEQFRLIPFIQKLPMKDTNYILKSATKLNNLFGIDTELIHTCRICGLDYTSNFRTTSEFFGPSID